MRWYVLERREGPIFGAQLRLRYGPTDGEVRIIPSYPQLVLRAVELGAFVGEQRVLTRHTKAMGEAWRYEELPLVVSRQHDTDPSAEGR
jgi:hypothetical protein